MTLPKTKWSLLISTLLWANLGFAAAPADQDFDAIAVQESGQFPWLVLDGVVYSADTTNDSVRVDTISQLTGGLPTLGSGNGITAAWYGTNTGSYFQFASVDDADDFKLESLRIEVWGGSSLTSEVYTVTGYDNDSPVVTATVTFTADGTYGVGNAAIVYDRQTTSQEDTNSVNTANAGLLTFGSDWINIDKVRFTVADAKILAVMLDQINFSDVDSPPAISSATYDASTGDLVVTGTDFVDTIGADNDVIANTFTVTGEGGSSYTLTDTADVEISSATAFTLTLSATDKAGVNVIINKNGANSTGTATYNLAGAAGFIAASALASDSVGNSITASDVPTPTISSATYNVSNGVLLVTGSGFSKYDGATNDIVANKFTLTGESGATHTLTDSSNVEISSGTSFMLILSPTDKAAALGLFNKNGTSSLDATTYNLAAAEDWAAGADAAVTIADLVANGITVSNVLTVPDSPTITSVTAGDSQATIAFTAPISNGGSNITGYTVTSIPDGITGTGLTSPILVTGLTNGSAYTFTITASNAVGESSATDESSAVTPRATQTITFNNPGAQNFGSSPTLTAFSDSGLTPGFTSSTSSVCTISEGGLLNFVSAGTCTINANQEGDDLYLSAAQVSRSFSVNPVVPGMPASVTATAGDAQATVAFAAPVSTGGVSIANYTVTASPGGATGTGSNSPITVQNLTNGFAYTFTVNATNSVGTGSDSGASNSITPGASQTITFANPGAQNFGTSPMLTASSDSGLTPSFTSSTNSVCTISGGGLLSFVSAGTCTINANQEGDESNLPAAQVSRSFSVDPVVSGVPTAVTATAGDAQATVAFAVPVSTGGAAITSYTVTASPGGFTATGSGSPIDVTGLTNDVAYTFTVTATNSVGTSAASGASNAVTPVSANTAPTITGTPAITVNNGAVYSFTPTATDADVDDVLTFSISNKPFWAAFSTTTGTLTGTPTSDDVGVTSSIVISVSDGTLSASLAAFNLTVAQAVDPSLPILTAPAEVSLNATGLYTPVSIAQLLSLTNANQSAIDAALKALAHSESLGNECCTTSPQGLNEGKKLLLAPGRHSVKWAAVNQAGVSVEATQIVNIKPLISFSKSQIVLRGTTAKLKVLLNGPSPVYPLTVPISIDASTSATASEYSLSVSEVVFSDAGQLQVEINVPSTVATGFSDSQLILALGGEGLNIGATSRHTISLRQGNVAPVVSLQVTQSGSPTSLITPTGGLVTVTAQVVDQNLADTHTFDWSATSGLADTDANPVDAVRVFNPAALTGSHKVSVTVMDSAGASVSAQASFRVITALPILSSADDSDNDGINDELEGSGDSDGNGIPNYLDNMPSSNILPQVGIITDAYLMECDPGVRCGLGIFALEGGSGGVQILSNEIGSNTPITPDPSFQPVGGIFDFSINDLPTPGQSVRVVIPQQAPIPAGGIYRKYTNGQWLTFIENANNSVHSTQGSEGYCPPPGSSDWQPGLTAGHYCVQLAIEDGGPNDADGLVNASVEDPGAVSVALDVVAPPIVPPQPAIEIKSKGGGAMDSFWLLLLGGLLASTRVKPARLFLAALVATSASAQAAAPEGAYMRVDIIEATNTMNKAAYKAALESAGHDFTLTKYDDKRNGYQLSVGYHWANSTYTELGYLDLGDVEVNLLLDGAADLAAFKQDFATYYPSTANGFTLVHGVSLQACKHVRASLEAGAFIWREDVNVNQANFGMKDDDGIDPIAGARIDVDLHRAVSVGLSARRIYFDNDEVDMLSVSGSYRF